MRQMKKSQKKNREKFNELNFLRQNHGLRQRVATQAIFAARWRRNNFQKIASPSKAKNRSCSRDLTRHHLEPVMQQEINDIGTFSTTSEEFGSFTNKLPVGQKYHLIKSHFVSSINCKFPMRILHQCRRGLQTRHLSDYPWMVYSPSVDGVFCKYCALRIPMHCRKDEGAFVNKPFKNWRKLQEKAKRHKQMKYYHDAMIATESLLNSVENPE